jgi:hypothetical protein
VTALSVMKLIPQPPGKIVEGQIIYDGKNLVDMPAGQMRKIRGKEISMIFQEPMTSLNPVFTCGEQIAEAVRLHEGLGRRDAMDKTVEMLKLVHIPNAERRVKEYPHQLSGGAPVRRIPDPGVLGPHPPPPTHVGSLGELIAAGVPGCMARPAGLGRRHKFGSEGPGAPGRLVRLIASLAPATAPD